MTYTHTGILLSGSLSLALLCALRPASAAEWSGWAGIQAQAYAEKGLSNQAQLHSSAAAQVELYHAFAQTNWEATLEVFARVDEQDSERSHADIREGHLLGIYDNWEFKIGISKEYWGATEFAHLVDVINQTDSVENIDGEDKFGQPMIKASWYDSWGSLEGFILPGFRERSFPGADGRFHITPRTIDINNASYESSAEEWHTDAALRLNRNFNNFDLGLAVFNGTNRDPLIIQQSNGTLTPYYEQMTQGSIDISASIAQWLLKAEALYRDSTSDHYSAASAGIEYTTVGIADSDADLGFIVEYTWDQRGHDAPTFIQNDLFLATRLTLNNINNTAVLLGYLVDLDGGGNLLNLEYSQRLNDSYTIDVQLRTFSNTNPSAPLHAFRADDSMLIEVLYHF